MSQSDSASDSNADESTDSDGQLQTGPGRRRAVRLFAREFNQATIQFKDESEVDDGEDESRAANYSLLPTGGRANRVLVMGVCTEIDQLGDNMYRAKVVDSTASDEAFFIYAGQYNPGIVDLLASLEPPEHLVVVGKPEPFDTDEGDTYVSIDPEDVAVTDAETRDRWAVETAEQTLDRIEALESGTAPYGVHAQEHYDVDVNALRDDVRSVLEMVNTDADEGQAAA